MRPLHKSTQILLLLCVNFWEDYNNLKTGMNIFKKMQRLKDLRDYCVP